MLFNQIYLLVKSTLKLVKFYDRFKRRSRQNNKTQLVPLSSLMCQPKTKNLIYSVKRLNKYLTNLGLSRLDHYQANQLLKVVKVSKANNLHNKPAKPLFTILASK